jgi:hypothetical protein
MGGIYETSSHFARAIQKVTSNKMTRSFPALPPAQRDALSEHMGQFASQVYKQHGVAGAKASAQAMLQQFETQIKSLAEGMPSIGTDANGAAAQEVEKILAGFGAKPATHIATEGAQKASGLEFDLHLSPSINPDVDEKSLQRGMEDIKRYFSTSNQNGFLKQMDGLGVQRVRNIVQSDSAYDYIINVVSKDGGQRQLHIEDEKALGQSLQGLAKQAKIGLHSGDRVVIMKQQMKEAAGVRAIQFEPLHQRPIPLEEASKFGRVEKLLNAAETGKFDLSKGLLDSIKKSEHKGWLAVNSALGALFLYQTVQGFRQDRQMRVAQADAMGQPRPSPLSSLTMHTLLNGFFAGISFAGAAAMLKGGGGHYR